MIESFVAISELVPTFYVRKESPMLDIMHIENGILKVLREEFVYVLLY
jgi:hypothetical protein